MSLREKSVRTFNASNYYKTRMCKDWEELERCPRGDKCTYAHGLEDLKTRQKPPKPSSASPKPLPKAGPHSVCKFFTSGYCRNGDLCNFIHKKPKEETSFEEDWNAEEFQQTIDSDARGHIDRKPDIKPKPQKPVPAPSSSRISSSVGELTENNDLDRMAELRLAALKRASSAAVNTTSTEAFPWSACLHIYNLGFNLSIQELKEMFASFHSCGWEFTQCGEEFVAKVYFAMHDEALKARNFYDGHLLDGRPMRFDIVTNPVTEERGQLKDFPCAQSLAAHSKSSLFKEFLFGDANTADCTLVIGEDRFLIHKSFVAHHSTYFKGVFAGSPVKVYEVDVKERSEALKDVLDIIYEYDFAARLPRSGDINGLDEYLTRAMGALRLAHELGIRVVRRYFDGQFHRWLCPSSCPRCNSLEHLDRLAISQLHKNDGQDPHPVVEKFRTLVDLLSTY